MYSAFPQNLCTRAGDQMTSRNDVQTWGPRVKSPVLGELSHHLIFMQRKWIRLMFSRKLVREKRERCVKRKIFSITNQYPISRSTNPRKGMGSSRIHSLIIWSERELNKQRQITNITTLEFHSLHLTTEQRNINLHDNVFFLNYSQSNKNFTLHLN